MAKNYLDEKQIRQLERAVTGYFDYIEDLIERENVFTMEEFEKNHINFMAFNNGDVVMEKSFEDNRFKEYLEANAPITEIKAEVMELIDIFYL